MGLGIILMTLLVGGAWLLAGRSSDGRGVGEGHPDIDSDELDDAENELRRFSGSASPGDVEQSFNDWGPGAPKPPRPG